MADAAAASGSRTPPRTDSVMTNDPSSSSPSSSARKDIVHVEVRIKQPTTNAYQGDWQPFDVAQRVEDFLRGNCVSVDCDAAVSDKTWSIYDVDLANHVESIRVAEALSGRSRVPIEECDFRIYEYEAINTVEELSAGDPEGADEGQDLMAATVSELPSAGIDGTWETLIYGDDTKQRLLRYVQSTLLFSKMKVDFNVINWNRVVLLHGPPGTGKTSLCRALAHKLSIRMRDQFSHGKLVEINSHSLFSKWFSESGKLVQRLFALIDELIEDDKAFVVILIDEVESLTAARQAAASGTEPSDAVRVVNAVLTQLDRLKSRDNVLIMTTSNISGSIDHAFIDRADIKQYIGLPPPAAIYWILRSCLDELMRAGVMATEILYSWQTLDMADAHRDRDKRASWRLRNLAESCSGLSARTLRKLPMLAYARYVSASTATMPVSFDSYMDALQLSLADSLRESQHAAEGQPRLGGGGGGGVNGAPNGMMLA